MALSRRGACGHSSEDSSQVPERPRRGQRGLSSPAGWSGGAGRPGLEQAGGPRPPFPLPKAARTTCPLPDKAGRATRRLIPDGKLKPRCSVTAAICHWTSVHINSLIQTTLPPPPLLPFRSFPLAGFKVTDTVQCPSEGPSFLLLVELSMLKCFILSSRQPHDIRIVIMPTCQRPELNHWAKVMQTRGRTRC